ncbi:hypothetical protein CACET_c31730 [Clostridium aceticum]|uniref:Uncharacterized protein n=1 Tax=Clostridium aceticum TaxID=84022 RepID=A0A0D8I7S6_9CLOT|nr:hypothetical protein [Clostridium aceticum]AKL96617.1 hypothetical protein CACET_c31730 [Clostridium aceticum]KJF26077.1 hypothetical protein TZ02_15265 [Clostridium aceticum]
MPTVDAMSPYLEAALLNHVFRGTQYTSPTPRVALFNGDPLNGGVEISGGGYSRATGITFTTPVVNGGKSIIENTEEIAFGPANNDWGLVNYVAIMDASSGGNVLIRGQLTNPRTILADDPARFLPGDMKIRLG